MVKNYSNVKSSKFYYFIFGITLILLAFFLFILFLLNGETKYTDSDPTAEVTKSVTCSSKNVSYPFFTVQNADSRNLEIIVIFDEKDTIDTISLSYSLSFGNPSEADSASTSNSISFSKAISDDNLPTDYFDDIFSTVDSNSIFRIMTGNKKLNGIVAKYFLLDEASFRSSIKTIVAEYNKKGLDCVISR